MFSALIIDYEEYAALEELLVAKRALSVQDKEEEEVQLVRRPVIELDRKNRYSIGLDG